MEVPRWYKRINIQPWWKSEMEKLAGATPTLRDGTNLNLDHADGFSFARGETLPPLLESNIGEAVKLAATLWPEVPALISLHERINWTYAELDARVNQLAAGLLKLGLNAGDRVAVWGPNCSAWTLLQFATARAGLVFVTFNTAYRQVELTHVLNLSGARAIVIAPGFKNIIDYAAELSGVDAPALRYRISLAAVPPSGYLAFDDVASADFSVLDAVRAPCTDAVNLQFTSGTTGRPKAVTLPHRNILNNGAAVGARAGIRQGDRICIPVPLYHCFGMVVGNLAAITHGATMVYPAPGFDPEATLLAIESEKCTHCYGVPTMFIGMLASPAFGMRDLSSLRGGIMAGSPCPAEVMRRVIDRMGMSGVTSAYGMTETSPVSAQTFVDDPMNLRVETVGRVMPHLEIKIVDEEGRIVPCGIEGELCTRGYSVMLGYWRDPEATARSIDADGFMHSGDLATMDRDGVVRITGRAKDMIIRGGENISPREIEEYLYRHPGIRDVAVIGLPDERFGEAVCAWVVKANEAELDASEVMEFCRGKLAHFKIPSQVRFVEELPMTASGKIQKFVIRAAMAEELANRR
jgi:fatty-acyl-CoA synthase